MTVQIVRWSFGSLRSLVGCAAAAVIVLPSVVMAQPGDHVRIGDAELVPKLVLGSHYRTNVYLQEAGESSGFALLLQPSADLKLDGQDLELGLGAGYKLRKYLSSDLANLDRFRDGNFDLDLGLLPHSVVGFNLREDFRSSSRESEAWYSESSALITHLRNDLSGGVVYHPGGALEAEAGGHFVFDDYNVPENSNIELDSNYNARLAYGPRGEFKWRFFPRTALLLSASYDWFKWNNNLVNIQEAAGQSSTVYGSYLGIPDGTLFEVAGGVRGRFTERIAIGLVVGYNAAVYDEQTVLDDGANEDASGDLDPIADGFGKDAEGLDKLSLEANFGYDLSETHKVAIGFDRGLSDSYFTNYLVHSYIYLRYSVLLGTRVGFGAEGGYRFEAFNGEVTRNDHVLRARGNLTYAATDWVAVGGGVWWDRRASADGIANIEYDDVNVNLALTFTY